LTQTETAFGVSYIEHLKLYTLKELAVCQTLGKLGEQNQSMYVGHYWLPESKEDQLQRGIDELKKKTKDFAGVIITRSDPHGHGGSQFLYLESNSPPTFFYTNEWLEPFQQIVNTYGIPRYKEINPAPFCVATFPFLFGIMFGDIGHGIILLLSTYSLFQMKPSVNGDDMISGLVKSKYLFLLMSLFSIYCGLIYNDFLALPTNLVSTCYDERVQNHQLFYDRRPNCMPTFGIDPVWGKSKNEISYMNSFKMKMSIIIGVIQMTLGLLIKGCNSILWKDPILFFCEFIPQLSFLSCSFGYMVFCIVLKWLKDWSGNPNPPMIINTFINFVTTANPPLFASADKQLELQKTLGSKLKD
jgi:V-type H+-transporting ATPase subunit a